MHYFPTILSSLRQTVTARRTACSILWLLPPVTAFYLMQLVYGGSLRFSPGVVVGNALCLGCGYALLAVLTGSLALSCTVLHLAAGIWGAVNYFVTTYRGNPVLPWDLTALGTAAAVGGSYSYRPTPRMVLALVLFLALLAALLRAARAGWLPTLRKRPLLRLACLAAGLVCLIPVVFPKTLDRFGIRSDVWNQSGAYRTSGALGAFLRNTEFMNVEVPGSTTPEHLDQIMAEVPAAATPAAGADRPNIIAIMNESWADFEEFGHLSLSESVTDYVRSLPDAQFGHTYTSVFGAGTSASEFEFLTGNSMAFLPSGSIPYQQYILKDAPSLASLLKDQGYRTLAFHPGERTSWQRDQAYPRLGFDRFKCGDDMDVPQTMEHGYVSDRSDFHQLIWELEHKEKGQPLFLFNVTIQSHGSYTAADFPAQVHLADAPGQYPMAEQYLTLANLTDQALKTLIDYLRDYDEPTLLLMFGDHQPSVEQGFLDMAYGVTQDRMSMDQYMDKFRTPYVFWANYPVDWDGPGDNTSLNFLGQYLLKYAGIPTDDYGRYLWDLQATLPALTFVGYTDADGTAYSHLATTEYTEKIRDYQRMQYVRLFGWPK